MDFYSISILPRSIFSVPIARSIFVLALYPKMQTAPRFNYHYEELRTLTSTETKLNRLFWIWGFEIFSRIAFIVASPSCS